MLISRKWYDSIQKMKKRGYEKEDMREVFADEPKEKGGRWKTALGITLLVVFLILGTAYGCGVIYFRDKFFTGTSINDMEVSYDTVEDVENRVANDVEKYRLLIKERGGSEEIIRASDIDYHYTPSGEVNKFKEDQNSLKWPLIFFRSFSYTFQSSAMYDSSKLKDMVNQLKCLDLASEEEPQDAKLVFNGMTYELKKEQQGKKLNREKLYAAIKRAIETGETTVDLEAADCYEKPAVTSENAALRKTYELLYRYTNTRVEYQIGEEKEVLDGSIINNWLSVDEDGAVNLNTEGIVEYVFRLAEKYDTYNKTRNFKTHDGSYVEVTGGSYGWLIDQEAEIAQLTQLVKEGRQVTREPVYAQTAATRENCDLGDSYVEIDLSRQHLWMYQDGDVIVETDFVSGDVSKDHTTPEGTYSLYWKKSPSVLKSDTPGDSYETEVTYWMPFNGGIGLHDASWRGAFGGNIYQYNGSHGCVNLPVWAAAEIYNNIEAGYPIICYYR